MDPYWTKVADRKFYILLRGMSIENYDGPEDLLKKLSGSDSAKIPS